MAEARDKGTAALVDREIPHHETTSTSPSTREFEDEHSTPARVIHAFNYSQPTPLPPTDGGKDAWLCLIGGFILEVNAWGFPYAFGVLQEYYTSHEPFKKNGYDSSLIGSCCIGIMHLASPFILFTLQRWPLLERWSSCIGLVIICTGIVSSSFSSEIWQLVITQGVVYALGACLLYYPVLLFIDQWFIHKKGLAYGVCWAGSGVTGVVFPLLMRLGLSKFSFPTVMRAWAVITVILVAPVLRFVKPRTQRNSHYEGVQSPMNFRFLFSRLFIIFQLGNILQGLGYSIPSLYLSTYARIVTGASNIETTAPTVCLNVGMMLGFLMMGYFVDRWHVANILGAVALVTLLSVFLVWGLSMSLAPLSIFAFIYGISAGGSSVTWTGIGQEMRKTDRTIPMGLVIGLMAAGRGIGAVTCGPISKSLLTSWPEKKSQAFGYGTEFGVLIIFTGVTSMFSALGFGARQLGVI